MSTDLLIIIATLVACFGVSLFLIRKWLSNKANVDSALTPWLQSLQSSIESTNRALNETMRGTSMDVAKLLSENTRQLNDRLDTAAKVISDVQKNLGEMSEVGRGIKSLQDFLQSPKLRGGLGEEVLSDMIGQTFPKGAFHLQYSFKSGHKVDAILKTEAGMLCIDSKFPMENFNAMVRGETEAERARAKKDFISDVKHHIESISRKYILPEEGTMDFALMYIPAENIYYEVVNTPELSKFARNLRVYPVSPNTLYAHLQVLFISFQGKQMEARSKEVFKILRAIQKDYQKVEENIGVLNRHITNSYNQMSNVSNSFNQIGQKLTLTNQLNEPASENLIENN